MDGPGDGDVAQAGIVEEEPIREIALLIDDLKYGIEEGGAVLAERSRPRRVRQNLSPREELVLMRLKELVAHDQARGKVRQKSDRPLRIGDNLPKCGGEQVEACRRHALCRCQTEAGQ